jgi:hypothetical protein
LNGGAESPHKKATQLSLPAVLNVAFSSVPHGRAKISIIISWNDIRPLPGGARPAASRANIHELFFFFRCDYDIIPLSV